MFCSCVCVCVCVCVSLCLCFWLCLCVCVTVSVCDCMFMIAFIPVFYHSVVVYIISPSLCANSHRSWSTEGPDQADQWEVCRCGRPPVARPGDISFIRLLLLLLLLLLHQREVPPCARQAETLLCVVAALSACCLVVFTQVPFTASPHVLFLAHSCLCCARLLNMCRIYIAWVEWPLMSVVWNSTICSYLVSRSQHNL